MQAASVTPGVYPPELLTSVVSEKWSASSTVISHAPDPEAPAACQVLPVI